MIVKFRFANLQEKLESDASNKLDKVVCRIVERRLHSNTFDRNKLFLTHLALLDAKYYTVSVKFLLDNF